MTGGMHRAGVNHRDCYICHFLLHTDRPVTADDFKLSVIDLHRAQTRADLPLRWRDKDLAALYSALDIGLTRATSCVSSKATSSSRCARSSPRSGAP
jgi:heptose I phosphotransferase